MRLKLGSVSLKKLVHQNKQWAQIDACTLLVGNLFDGFVFYSKHIDNALWMNDKNGTHWQLTITSPIINFTVTISSCVCLIAVVWNMFRNTLIYTVLSASTHKYHQIYSDLLKGSARCSLYYNQIHGIHCLRLTICSSLHLFLVTLIFYFHVISS